MIEKTPPLTKNLVLSEEEVLSCVDKTGKPLRPIFSRWVFKIKSDGRYKGRLVARGYSQRKGIDLEETFPPVAKFPSFRLLLSIFPSPLQHASGTGGSHGIEFVLHQMDFIPAYLNGPLEDYEHILLELPDGRVVKLCKGMYGLKQAGRTWYTEIDKFFCSIGFLRSEADHAIYFKENLVILLYVDDLVLLGELEAVKQLLLCW